MPLAWAASRAQVDRVVLRQEGTEGEHDHVDEAPVGGNLDLLGLEAVMRGEADEASLPVFLMASTASFISLLLGQSTWLLERPWKKSRSI